LDPGVKPGGDEALIRRSGSNRLSGRQAELEDQRAL
jgi:hypothetical protein